MNPVRRWFKFNVVGVAGMLVQLVTLAGLNHIVPRHYLLNSLLAVETAILHNFVAHVHYTWRDRIAWRDRGSRVLLLSALWRFQVSNGGVSLAGNAVLMRLLVGATHLPVLVANGVAVVACGLVNFWLGDAWAFATRKGASARRLCWPGIAAALLVLQVGMAVGQGVPAATQSSPAGTQSAPVAAQTAPAALKVKEDVARIRLDGKMTVRMMDGVEYHGRLDSVGEERFALREVDLRQTLTLKYADVLGVKNNYGGRGFGGRRVDPVRSAIVGVAIVAGLLTLVFVAVASDKS